MLDIFSSVKEIEEQSPADKMFLLNLTSQQMLGAKWVYYKKIKQAGEGSSFFKEKLLAKKYPTLIEEVETKSGLHYRIRLGPMDDYDLAKQLSARLEKDFKVKGWVAKY